MPEQSLLPERFAALEPFAAIWALDLASARHEQRMRATMAEIRAFYAAILPHLEDVLRYLDEFEFSKLAGAELRLHWLTLAAAEAGLSVEVYGSPTLPMAVDRSRYHVSYLNMDA